MKAKQYKLKPVPLIMQATTGKYSNKAFYSGSVSFLLLALTMASFVINKTSDGRVTTLSVLFPLLISIVFNLVGTFYAFKGLKEENSTKKILGLVLLLSFFILIGLLFVFNIGNILSVF